jgi:hypothetical protein
LVNFLKAILNFLKSIFFSGEVYDPLKDQKYLTPIYSVPKFGDKNSDVKILQEALNKTLKGNIKLLTVDGDFGPKTRAFLQEFQKSKGLEGTGVIPAKDGGKTFEYLGLKLVTKSQENQKTTEKYINPAYIEAKKHAGKKETDSVFNKWLSSFWGLVGLPNYKTIVGSSFAWCALFFFVMNHQVGQNVIASAGAKKIGQSGYEINWKVDGIPQGAGVWKNSSSCSSSSGNHITWADTDCSAEDLLKPKAQWPGFGGNQGDAVKTSWYCAKGDCGSKKDVICRVFWHSKDLPPKVTKSKDCKAPTSDTSEKTTSYFNIAREAA